MGATCPLPYPPGCCAAPTARPAASRSHSAPRGERRLEVSFVGQVAPDELLRRLVAGQGAGEAGNEAGLLCRPSAVARVDRAQRGQPFLCLTSLPCR